MLDEKLKFIAVVPPPLRGVIVIAPPEASNKITYWPPETPPLNVYALIVPVNPVTVAVEKV